MRSKKTIKRLLKGSHNPVLCNRVTEKIAIESDHSFNSYLTFIERDNVTDNK